MYFLTIRKEGGIKLGQTFISLWPIDSPLVAVILEEGEEEKRGL